MNQPYAIAGMTGRIGGAIARQLLAQGHRVRALVRDPAKAASWHASGCELVAANLEDTDALTRAFKGVAGAYVLVPPNFAPSPDLREARAAAVSIASAVRRSGVPNVVALSSIGGHRRSGLGLIGQTHLLEASLQTHLGALTILRPAWFFENNAWDVQPARDTGRIASYLQPPERPVPMVATADIARVAVDLLLKPEPGRRVVELEGPRRYSPQDIASGLAAALGRSVVPEVVPRDKWKALFQTEGTPDPSPRIEMLDGFNSGWIEFESPATVLRGVTELETVLRQLCATPPHQPRT